MSFFKDFKEEDAGTEDNVTVTNDETKDDNNVTDDSEEFDGEVDKELLGMIMDNSEENAVNEVPETTKPEKEPAAKQELSKEDKEAITVITKGTTINGSIMSDCSLDVMGTINGDIECLGKLTISGSVVGSSMASEIYVNTERLEGNLSSEGSVKIGLGTVIVGDITGTSAVIAGAVKGEIDINGPVVIDSTAIIKGNVKAKSVQMNNGAVLEGFCSLAYASVDIDNVFD